MKIASTRRPNVNVPNGLTVFRIVLIPVFIYLYLWGAFWDNGAALWWALGVFIVASATDQMDGYIARRNHLVTDFGKLADPLADKALTLTAFILLSIRGPIPYFWIFTVLVATREIGITILREVLRRQGTVVAASSGGKVKTVLQMALIVGMLIPWRSFIDSDTAWNVIFWVLVCLAVVTVVQTLFSGAQYCVGAWKGMRTAQDDAVVGRD